MHHSLSLLATIGDWDRQAWPPKGIAKRLFAGLIRHEAGRVTGVFTFPCLWDEDMLDLPALRHHSWSNPWLSWSNCQRTDKGTRYYIHLQPISASLAINSKVVKYIGNSFLQYFLGIPFGTNVGSRRNLLGIFLDYLWFCRSYVSCAMSIKETLINSLRHAF